jgi:hypothetical protein
MNNVSIYVALDRTMYWSLDWIEKVSAEENNGSKKGLSLLFGMHTFEDANERLKNVTPTESKRQFAAVLNEQTVW